MCFLFHLINILFCHFQRCGAFASVKTTRSWDRQEDPPVVRLHLWSEHRCQTAELRVTQNNNIILSCIPSNISVSLSLNLYFPVCHVFVKRCRSSLHARSGPFFFRGMCWHVSSFWLWGVSAEPTGWHREDGLESLILWHWDLGDNTTVCIEQILTIDMSNTCVSLKFHCNMAAVQTVCTNAFHRIFCLYVI